MKKTLAILSIIPSLLSAGEYYIPQNGESYTIDDFGIQYCGAAGEDASKTSEVFWRNSKIKAWATGYKDLAYGANVIDKWKTPEKALGSAGLTDYGNTDPSSPNYDPDASSLYHIVSLGDGGSITMTFDRVITNGDGFDFAVFENAVNAGFLELAYVSVSTDGINFATFPNFYVGGDPIGSYDNVNYPEYVYNLASKYVNEFGHGFDLSELEFAYNYAKAHYDPETDSVINNSAFSLEYTKHILESFELIDINEINYIKIDDIVGDGSCVDSAGNPIYDPYPTSESGGFDLNAIGVLNQVPEPASTCAVFAVASLAIAAFARRKRA